jgi:hypothetical protein
MKTANCFSCQISHHRVDVLPYQAWHRQTPGTGPCQPGYPGTQSGGGWFMARMAGGEEQQSLPRGALHMLPDERVDPWRDGTFWKWASSV